MQLLEIQNLSTQTGPNESDLLFNKIPGGIICTSKFKKHQANPNGSFYK